MQQTDGTSHKLKPRLFWEVCITELIVQSFHTLYIPELTMPDMSILYHTVVHSVPSNSSIFQQFIIYIQLGELFA